jgi:hypothetical protein
MITDTYQTAREKAQIAVDQGLGMDALYWASWFAARQTAAALLDKAKAIGVTPEQWEQLRQVAAEVAPD